MRFPGIAALADPHGFRQAAASVGLPLCLSALALWWAWAWAVRAWGFRCPLLWWGCLSMVKASAVTHGLEFIRALPLWLLCLSRFV